MASLVDRTIPTDGRPALPAGLRANLSAAKAEIEALQARQVSTGGAAGRVLAKNTATGYDTGWSTVNGHAIATAEEDLSDACTPVAADLGRLKRYTGSGHTWTIDAVAGVGEVAVENDGTGAVTLAVGTATLSGGVTVPAGKGATLRFFAGGAKCKALVEG